MGRIWTKVGYGILIGKQSILANHTSLARQTNTGCTFIEDANSVLLKHQKDILNCWRKYCCELLNPVTLRHLETAEEQIGGKIYDSKAKVITAIKSLKAGKAPGEDNI